VLGAAVAAGLRHQSLRVAVLVAVGIVATHAVVLTGAVRGISHS
jgi:hypothetical protein